jgi:activator-of-BECN1-regulated-autophagy protein 1
MDTNAADRYDPLVSPMETFPAVPSSSYTSAEGIVSNAFPSGMGNSVSNSREDAMETDEMQSVGGNPQGNSVNLETFGVGNSATDGVPAHTSVRQQSTDFGQLQQFLPSRDSTRWELPPFLQGWLMGQSQAGVPSTLPLNSGGHELSAQYFGPSSLASYLSTQNVEAAVASLAMPGSTSLSGVSGRSGSRHRVSRSRFSVPESGESVAPINMQHEGTDNQPLFNRIQSEIATSLAAAAELPCTVKLRVWSHDIEHPCAPLNSDKCRLTIPHAVLCRYVEGYGFSLSFCFSYDFYLTNQHDGNKNFGLKRNYLFVDSLLHSLLATAWMGCFCCIFMFSEHQITASILSQVIMASLVKSFGVAFY